jgi:hypothetical protein
MKIQQESGVTAAFWFNGGWGVGNGQRKITRARQGIATS